MLSAMRFIISALGIIGLALAAGSAAVADPMPAAEQYCPASTPEQAHGLGDALFAQGAYQRAGACYELSGDYARANRAFLAALEPQASATSHQLALERDQARSLLQQVRRSFRGAH